MSRTAKAYARMGKCIGGVRYVPESEMLALEQKNSDLKLLLYAKNTSKGLLIETLYDALRVIAPHYDGLVSRFIPSERQPAYRDLYTQAMNAMNAKEQYEEAIDI